MLYLCNRMPRGMAKADEPASAAKRGSLGAEIVRGDAKGAPANPLTMALTVALALGYGAPAWSAGLSAFTPMGLFNYDASVLDNPYLRTNNFYGYDKVDVGDDDRWTDLFGDFTLPILANIGVAGFYDDNVLLNNLNRRGSFGTALTPSLTMPFGSDKVFTTLNYSLRANVYENVGYANTVGNYLNGSTSIEFDHRNHLVLSARWASAQDPLGTMFSQGSLANILQQPNHWNGYGFDAAYRYGGDGAKGNLLMNFSMDNREYTNNPTITYQRNLNNYNIGGAFLWRVLPKTQVLFEAQDSILDYHNLQTNGTSLNGSMYRVYTGATWVASAKTRAVAKVGYQIRTFDDTVYSTRTGPAFQGMLSWSPGSFDSVWAEVSNAINETYIGNSIAASTQNYTLNWRHNWLERFSTSLGAFYLAQQFVESSLEFNTITGRLTAMYTFRQGVWADLQYTFTDRTSNQNQYDFTRNLVMLNFRMLF